MGTVVKCLPDSVIIQSDRLNDTFAIGIEQWKEITYDGVEEVVIGTYDQIPLKLSWAITIHKSQGLSLENICLTYVKGMSRELVYVGLSRCTNFENLYVNIT
jgi:ATP-dependent exoDNAse (exonuclease V) alpha subunit